MDVKDIPLLLRANPYKLACVAYAFALLEGFEEPNERHIHLAYKWLDYCAKDIELDKYVEWWRSQHQLSDEDYITFKDQIESEITADIKEHGGIREETYTFKLIEYLTKNEKGQRDELAAYLNVDPKTVSRKANLLKGLGLLRSDIGGYHFTAKGVRFFKRWFNEAFAVPHVPTFEGQGGSETDREPKPKGGLTPKTGDIRDMKPALDSDASDAIFPLLWVVSKRNLKKLKRGS